MRVLFLGAGGRTWDRSLTSWRLTSAGFLGIGIREGGVVKGGVVLKAWLFGGNLNAFLRVNGAWENAATRSLGKAGGILALSVTKGVELHASGWLDGSKAYCCGEQFHESSSSEGLEVDDTLSGGSLSSELEEVGDCDSRLFSSGFNGRMKSMGDSKS